MIGMLYLIAHQCSCHLFDSPTTCALKRKKGARSLSWVSSLQLREEQACFQSFDKVASGADEGPRHFPLCFSLFLFLCFFLSFFLSFPPVSPRVRGGTFLHVHEVVFRIFDINGDGRINRQELYKSLKSEAFQDSRPPQAPHALPQGPKAQGANSAPRIPLI